MYLCSIVLSGRAAKIIRHKTNTIIVFKNDIIRNLFRECDIIRKNILRFILFIQFFGSAQKYVP